MGPLDDAEQGLLSLLQFIRDARSREDALKSANRKMQAEAEALRRSAEAARHEQERLTRDLAALQKQARVWRAKCEAQASVPEQLTHIANAAKAQGDESNALLKNRMDSGARTNSLTCRGGVLPLPCARTGSCGNLQLLRDAGNPTPSNGINFSLSGTDQLPDATALASSFFSKPFVKRNGTWDLSSLMSVLMTANLMHQDSVPLTSASQSVEPIQWPPRKGEHGDVVCAPLGSANTVGTTKSMSDPVRADIGLCDASARHTLQTEALAPQHVDMDSVGNVSSVALVDNDGTSGVGLAAAAAVAAAAARAWAAAATSQKQHVQHVQQRLQFSSLRSISGSEASASADAAMLERDTSGRHSFSQLTTNGQAPSGRKPGKVGYKLVASVYRESTPKAPTPLSRVHAQSSVNVASTPTAHTASLHHSATQPDFFYQAQQQPRTQTTASAGAADSSQHTADNNITAGPSLMPRRAVSAEDAVPQVPSTLNKMSKVASLLDMGVQTATSPVRTDSAFAVATADGERKLPSLRQLRLVSERRGGWYDRGGVRTDSDDDDDDDGGGGSGVHSAAIPALQQGPVETLAPPLHLNRPLNPNPTSDSTTTTTTLEGACTGDVTTTTEPESVAAVTGTLDAKMHDSSSAAQSIMLSTAMPGAHAALLPPLLTTVGEPTGHLQGCFTVLEPVTCPGCHLADTSAVRAAVSHAVPAQLTGVALRRPAQSVNVVLKRDDSGSARRPTLARTSLDAGMSYGSASRHSSICTSPHNYPSSPVHKASVVVPPLLPLPPLSEPSEPSAPAAMSLKLPTIPAVVANLDRTAAAVGSDTESLPSAAGVDESVQPTCTVCSTTDMNKVTALTLHWLSLPRTALVVCKLSPSVYPLLNTVLRWLRARDLSVYVEPEGFAHVDPDLIQGQGRPDPNCHGSSESHDGCSPEAESGVSGVGGVLTWSTGRCANHSIPDEVAQDLDFVVVLGGDGTLLWTCHVFGNRAVPPLVPFNMGSLGFLTPFPPSQHDEILKLVLEGGFSMILRHRLHAIIVRAAREGGPLSCPVDSFWMDGHCATEKVVLNEVVVDRGISPFLTNLECFCDGNFVTHVQGDGLIISTPTGSTAYSLAAGGSMVHPQVPGILFTPVCPHSLSFRPLVFPDHVQLCIQVPQGARSQMYCSFDGKDRMELHAGDAILVRMSQWPIPTVCSRDPSRDWFTGIREGLNWNVRRIQGQTGM